MHAPNRPVAENIQTQNSMMIEIPIKQVATKTVGGFDATIDALSPTSTDCIVGTLKTANGVKEVSWDKYGRCRDNHTDCNLDMEVNEHFDVASVASALNEQVTAEVKNLTRR